MGVFATIMTELVAEVQQIELVKLHIKDKTAVGKPPGQSKAATLDML